MCHARTAATMGVTATVQSTVTAYITAAVTAFGTATGKPSRIGLPALILASLSVLGGCMDRDPYRRTDVWRPTGANSSNIAAQVANPNDLIRGQGGGRAGSGAQVLAVERVVTDQARPLNPSAPAGGGGQSGNGGNGGGGAAAGVGAAAAGATQ